MLHGRGGTGARKLQAQRSMKDRIIITPDGYKKGWSLQRPDVDFIRQIINYIKTCKITDGSNIAIHGASNGAGLLNQLMIEKVFKKYHPLECELGRKFASKDELFRLKYPYASSTSRNAFKKGID